MAEKKIPDLFPDTKETTSDFDGAPGQKAQISGVLPGQMVPQHSCLLYFYLLLLNL